LDEVKKGIPPSAGCGIGIERLIRFICNLKSVAEARLFAKLPGTLSI
ncbi:MAG: asparagine synthetase, partial [Caldiserica bacterium]|nr:asparagine synthetase [Caldisericota bacterium]